MKNKSEKERNTTVDQAKEKEQRSVDRTKYPPTDYLPIQERIITDPLGSWTGVPVDNKLDTPVQDADDL
jgi:hypothetical protein